MFEIFKTLLLSSSLGVAITILLLIVKPFMQKHFSVKWQHSMWIIATVCMIIPVWKAIPQQEAQKITPITANQTVQPRTQTQTHAQTAEEKQKNASTVITEEIPMKYREISAFSIRHLRIYDLIAYIWAIGVGIFFLLVVGNYVTFLFRKKRNSMDLPQNTVLEEVKKELGIKRHIRVRISNDTASPMLVGIFSPVIYIPQQGISKDAERMVFLHELTHYKHGDLIYKWLALIVNAVHWFNPIAYLLSANVSQSCEIFCDMSIVKDMDEKNKVLYMKTILSLAENGGKKNV